MKRLYNIIILVVINLCLLFTISCVNPAKNIFEQVIDEIGFVIYDDIDLDGLSIPFVSIKSDHPEIIDEDGNVTKGLQDTLVTITISIGDLFETQETQVLVKAITLDELKQRYEKELNEVLTSISNIKDSEYLNNLSKKIEELRKKVKNYTDLESCYNYYESIKNEVNGYKRIYDLYIIKTDELENYFGSIDQLQLTAEAKEKLLTLKEETIKNMKNAFTENALNEIISLAFSKADSICGEKEKTDIEKCLEIEDDLADILNLSGQVIRRNITLKEYSLYNSVIIWSSNNEEVLSNEGVVASDVDNVKVTLSYKVILNGNTYDGIAIDLYVNTTENELPSYYNSINLSLTGIALRNSLRTLITDTHKKHTSYSELKSVLCKADSLPNDSSKMILFYTRTIHPATYSTSVWNREHVWPKSLSWFYESEAGSDAHHLRPTNPTANSTRNNNPYGEVEHTSFSEKKVNGVTYGYLSGGVFEPLDEVKGDAARILMYLLVRYKESDSYSVLKAITSYEILLRWNDEDPVDDLERNRNEVVYEIQGNRNPFIDYPDFARMIFNENGYIKSTTYSKTFNIPLYGTFTFEI